MDSIDVINAQIEAAKAKVRSGALIMLYWPLIDGGHELVRLPKTSEKGNASLSAG